MIIYKSNGISSLNYCLLLFVYLWIADCECVTLMMLVAMAAEAVGPLQPTYPANANSQTPAAPGSDLNDASNRGSGQNMP